MPSVRPHNLFASAAACLALLAAGCHSNGMGAGIWGGTARVPPPNTSSYGTAASYYQRNSTNPGVPGGLPPAAPTPPTNGPPAVPATGTRPPTTTGASYNAPVGNSPNYQYSASPIPTVPPTVQLAAPPPASFSTSPNVPPTYLSTPARVDQMLPPGNSASGVQPAGAYDLPPSPSATIPGNSLRWGTR